MDEEGVREERQDQSGVQGIKGKRRSARSSQTRQGNGEGIHDELCEGDEERSAKEEIGKR